MPLGLGLSSNLGLGLDLGLGLVCKILLTKSRLIPILVGSGLVAGLSFDNGWFKVAS